MTGVQTCALPIYLSTGDSWLAVYSLVDCQLTFVESIWSANRLINILLRVHWLRKSMPMNGTLIQTALLITAYSMFQLKRCLYWTVHCACNPMHTYHAHTQYSNLYTLTIRNHRIMTLPSLPVQNNIPIVGPLVALFLP